MLQKRFYYNIIFLLIIFLLNLFAVNSHANKRVALVIGNSNYVNSPLKNPVHDAKDIAISLKKLDFDVILKTNIDLRKTDNAIDKFYRKLQEADVGFFYYAGHGVQVDGMNYLIPLKANIISSNDVKYNAVPAGRILGRMEDAGNKLNIVVLDACRNNPFRSFTRSTSKGLAFMDAPDGTIVSYATSPGSVSFDGKDRNGIYTHHLLKNIMRPDLSIIQLFNQTGLDVKRATSGKQTPWMTNSPMEPYRLADGPFVVKGRLQVTSNPAGADLYVDGSHFGYTPVILLDLTQGTKTIRVEYDGYGPESKKVTIVPGGKSTVSFALSPIFKKGSLQVTSNPAGADLYVDGSRMGYTPVTLSHLTQGTKTIRVEYDGYSPKSKKVTIVPGNRSTVSFALSRIFKKGWLTITTKPRDATVRILNIGPLYTNGMALESGRYQVEVSAKGYEKDTQWVKLEAGESLDVEIALAELKLKKDAEQTYSQGQKAESAGDYNRALEFYKKAESLAGEVGIRLSGLSTHIQGVEERLNSRQKKKPESRSRRRTIGTF